MTLRTKETDYRGKLDSREGNSPEGEGKVPDGILSERRIETPGSSLGSRQQKEKA